jgi:site-specific DNA-methyltransferase (cytosine-N4-specific)
MNAMRELTCQIKDYIQPFERQLALQELQALTAGTPIPVGAGPDEAVRFRVKTDVALIKLKTHLAYWQTVGTNKQEITYQLRSEATSLVARNGVDLQDIPRVVPQIVDTKLPNKRCLRYATHGLHEYRGKFFPQLVRALMNMARVSPNGIVIDPMCGSGTTLVEAALSGRQTFGLDMNPLSVFVTQIKCQVLGINPKVIITSFNRLSKNLQMPISKLNGSNYFGTLPEVDQDYLKRWYAVSVLEELDHIERAIQKQTPSAVRNFYRLCLSNVLRAVSWQKEDDLRVRKEVRIFDRGEVIARFLEEARRSAKTVAAFSTLRGGRGLGKYSVQEADARDAANVLRQVGGEVDAVITSPPYATALPYLDTDRLSLIYLGLLSRADHRSRDTLMIGNREVTERTRTVYWNTYVKDCRLLPEDTRALIERIDRLNSGGTVGFRRRNLSALLSKYFFDMREVIMQQFELLRSGGVMFMVIGNNRTTAGGEEIEIQTTAHLAKIAESIGFRLAGNLSMEMLTSRDIFRKNAMPSEQILTLQKDQ